MSRRRAAQSPMNTPQPRPSHPHSPIPLCLLTTEQEPHGMKTVKFWNDVAAPAAAGAAAVSLMWACEWAELCSW